MNKNTKIGAALGVLLLLGLIYILYQALVVIPKAEIASKAQEAEKQRTEERLQEMRRQVQYDQCVKTAYEVYTLDWNKQCEVDGLGKECGLPTWRADGFDADLQKDKDTCVLLYKTK